MHVIAIPYIRSHFNEGNAATKLKWDEYWTYFVNTWIKGIIPTTMWNIYELKNCQDVPADILRNRTNNPCEGFNSKLKKRFTSGRKPSMEQFVTTIRELSCEYVVTMDNIRLGKTKAPKYEQRLPFVFPKDY